MLRRAAVLALALLAAPPAAAVAQQGGAAPPKPPPPQQQQQPPPQTQELSVRNGTATVLLSLHLNAPDAPRPGPDLLGAGVLQPGQTFRARLPRPPECRMELRAVFQDQTEERRAVNLCRPEPVEFTDAALREIDVANDTDFELRELYLAPPGQAGGRGPDRLGAATVPPLDGLRLRLRGFAACEVEATAVFRNAPPETRRADICARPRLAYGDPTVPLREATLRNGTGATLRELYLRDEGATGWGADRLGAAVLAPGQSFLLRTRRAACRADLRAVFQTGREEVRQGLDLCAGQEVAFLPARRLVLLHDHLRPVREAYLSPVEDGDWGPDVLAGRPLARGERREVGMEGPGCAADLRVVFDNGGAEELRGFDLCARAEIRLRPGWVAE